MLLAVRLHRSNGAATDDEREVLARWQGWGAHPGVFDPRRNPTATEQAAREAIAEAELEWPGYGDIARGSILNAHYTDPVIIAPVWDALRRLGVDDGAVVWEPGCGVGEWLRSPHAPAARFDAIDLDPVSATITELLTGPEVHVTADTLERWVIARSTHTADGYDAVVGNVPFTKTAPEIDNPHRDSLHNYTIARAAGMTRPGGVIALITSRYTLDAGDSDFRERLAAEVDLIGAVRLPSDAHRAHAGTSVVTDLLLLRRPLPGEQRPPADWLSSTSTLVDGQPVRINDYFHTHPDRVLGSFALGGMRHRADLRVVANTDLVAGLTAALTEITAEAPAYAPAGRAPRAGDAYNPPGRRRITVDDLSLPAGTIVHRHGDFSVLTPTGPQPHTPRFQSYRGELAALCDLRDVLYRTMAADAAGDTMQAGEHRHALNGAYDRYTGRYGPLNRFSERSPARCGSDEDSDVVYRVDPVLGGFRHDPTWWTLAAVEVFDEQTQTAEKAPVFQRAVTRTATWPDTAANASDAVAISLAKHGRLDVDELAVLLDVDVDGVDFALGDLAFRQPGDARLVAATEYLAGDVVAKLAVAEAAALEDPQRWRRNVEGLRRVQPATIEAGDIVVRIGATWIDKSVIADYLAGLAEVRASSITIVHSAHIATWEISGPLTSKACGWGTRKRTLFELATDIANQRLTHITMTNADDKQVLDQDSTAEANDKRREIEDDFQDWVWRDPDRTQALVGAYNDRFNRWVAPVYDGSHLLLPGLAPTFTPRPKQLDGTWRILTSRDRGTLLAHAVGAGKTATMVMAAMEARRLGTAAGTVMIVVENSMLEQFSRELLQLYPGANVLVADSISFDPRRRKQFSGRVATGDFDVVVITHQGFKALPISDDWMRHVITTELAQIDAAARDVPERSRSSKQLASARDSYRKRLKELGERAGHDTDAITFEELNVSMLIVDEAQVYKNLAFDTQISGAGGQKGSAIAFDALTKIDWMREHQGPGSIVFATATPIANAISECWVMQRFLDPAGLDPAGCRHFDGWAANFARSVSTIEVKPTGGGFRTTSRFAEYTNVPELVAMFRATADVQTATDLNLPRPALIGGQQQIVAVPQTWDQARVLEWLEQRAISPSRNDCLLAVMTDGRLSALTPRLLGPRLVAAGVHYDNDQPGDQPGDVELPAKLDACASNVLDTWEQHRDRIYLTPAGEPSPNRGCAQIVFCDDGVPANENYDAYSALKTRLIEGGMDPTSIAFIHDAKTHRQRGELFSNVRDGHVAVLIGSIRQCGVGVNIQSRLAAMHQITVPWRPADIEQAEGRILRQGNQNLEVSIRRYVAERSFDAYSWQTIERKARSIAQIMSDPKTLDRTITDDSDPAATYALVKATATGDPRFLTHATLAAEVERLERLERSHQRNTRLAGDTITNTTRRTGQRTSLRDRLQPLLETEPVTTGFTPSSLDGTITASDIGTHAIDTSQRLNTAARWHDATEQLGVIDGIPIRLHVRRDSSVHATIDGIDVRACTAERAWTYHEFTAKRPEDIGRAITNIARSVPSTVHRLELDDATDAAAIETARTQLATPFKHGERLNAARNEHTALTTELMADKPKPSTGDTTADQRPDDRQYQALYRAHPQHRTVDWTV